MTTAVMPARSRPYLSYRYCSTSSRRSCSKSTSISGASFRSLADEPLEQHIGSLGIDRSSPPGNSRPPSSPPSHAPGTEFPHAGEADQVPHGQKIGFVMQLADQLQFMLDQPANFLRHALRITLAGPFPGQLRQILRGREPCGRSSSGYSYRNSSSENVQRSAISSVRCNASGSGSKGGSDFCDRAQMPLGIGKPGRADLRDRRLRAASPSALHAAAAEPGVIMHIPAATSGNCVCFAEREQVPASAARRRARETTPPADKRDRQNMSRIA